MLLSDSYFDRQWSNRIRFHFWFEEKKMGICLFEKIYARHFSFSKAGEIFQTVFITTPNPQNRSLGATSPPRDAMAVVLTCSRSLSGLDPPGLASPRQGHLLVASKRQDPAIGAVFSTVLYRAICDSSAMAGSPYIESDSRACPVPGAHDTVLALRSISHMLWIGKKKKNSMN